MTSAAAAARPPIGSRLVSDETIWSDPEDRRFDAYRRSKILAERAAWDFMAGYAGPTTMTTILPGAVFGPVLTRENRGSVEVIRRLLDGRPPGIPRLGFSVVDVRDLADLHIRAMTTAAAAGQRFLAAGEFMWMMDVANTLRRELGTRASKVPARRLPDAVVRLLSLSFLPQLRSLTPELGRRNEVSSEKARRVLGFAPRPAATTIVECADSLLGASTR
jgi:nucleoside-diphosphate-sugar epimerase